LGLGAVWLVMLALGSHNLAGFVGPLRTFLSLHSEPEVPSAGVGTAPLPAAASPDPSLVSAAEAASTASTGETPPGPIAAIAEDSRPTSPSGPAPDPTPKQTAPQIQLLPAEIAALTSRGDAFLAGGDIASARLFFERAADAGDGRAAMRMAVTYDPAFLQRIGLHGLQGDPGQAAHWYRLARSLGVGPGEPPSPATGAGAAAAPLLNPR